MELFKSIGFIGGGQMAEAIVQGLLDAGTVAPSAIYISDHKAERAGELSRRYGIHASVGAEGFIREVDVLILAVKPQALDGAWDELGQLRKNALLISIVAGVPLSRYESLGDSRRVIRVMPNTPLSIGEGMSCYALGKSATRRDAEIAQAVFGASGKAQEVTEAQMDAVTGLSGSGPAFVFVMIDALSDGGVAAGLKRQDAVLLAAQTVLGSAKMVLETGRHPDALRDAVTSPAGTTIEGVRTLEAGGFRHALIEAVLAAARRSAELGAR